MWKHVDTIVGFKRQCPFGDEVQFSCKGCETKEAPCDCASQKLRMILQRLASNVIAHAHCVVTQGVPYAFTVSNIKANSRSASFQKQLLGTQLQGTHDFRAKLNQGIYIYIYT